MIVIPAIDLKQGRVVRLFQGKPDAENVYSRNPATIARHWQKQGAQLIHVVDLDGAFTGSPQNLAGLKEIIKAVDVAVQFGGGVRTSAMIRQLLDMGVARVVLGTKAVQDKQFLSEAFAAFGKRIIVSIDAKKGIVLTEGWLTQAAGLYATDFAAQLGEIGFTELIYTDTLRDGTLQGPNIDALAELLRETGMKAIASGGVSSLEDLKNLKKLKSKGVTGIIIGKALYEEKFSLKEAIRLVGITKGGAV